MDKTVVKKVKIEDVRSDFAFWQSQSYEKRLETLEAIRQEYITWKYGNQQGFQRICTVTKRQ